MKKNNRITSKNISTIADVFLGFILRMSSQKTKSGDVRLIQMRNVNKSGNIEQNDFDFIPQNIIRQNNLLKQNDLIIANRGNFHKVAVFEEYKETVADSNFFIIRIKSKEILPRYLAFYLNQERVQKHIARLTAGTSAKKLSMDALKAFEVPVPTIATQEKFIELAELKQKESALLLKLKEKKELFIDSLLLEKVIHI